MNSLTYIARWFRLTRAQAIKRACCFHSPCQPIVAKQELFPEKLDAPYRSGPSKTWIKVKNPKAAAATRAITIIHSEIDAQVVLVSARKSRGAVHWDYADVRLGDASGVVIGRIMRHPQAPEDQPWFWTITAREADLGL